jgi:hypothetical protein
MVASRVVIHGARFVAFTCDEITTLDNQYRIFVHGYCVQDWCCIPILLLVKCIAKGSNAQNLTKVILATHVNFGSLIEEEVANSLLCFGANGVNIF